MSLGNEEFIIGRKPILNPIKYSEVIIESACQRKGCFAVKADNDEVFLDVRSIHTGLRRDGVEFYIRNNAGNMIEHWGNRRGHEKA